MDAIQALHTTLNQKGSSQWILDADISNCFNEIDQEVLLKRVLPIKLLDKLNFLLKMRLPEMNRAPVVAYSSRANRYQRR